MSTFHLKITRDRRTDLRTDGYNLIQICNGASKKTNQSPALIHSLALERMDARLMVGTFLEPMQPLDMGADSVADLGVEGDGEDPSLGGEKPFNGYD